MTADRERLADTLRSVEVEVWDGDRTFFTRLADPGHVAAVAIKALDSASSARWDALKSDLATRINQDDAVARSFPPGSETAAAHFSLVSANRTTLAKMRELEGS